MKTAQEFVTLWTYLGDHHKELNEETRVETENHLFAVKEKLTKKDLPYIMEHVEQSRVIQKALMSFLS